MITAELKDKILAFLVNNHDDLYYQFDGAKLAPELGTTPKILAAIIEDLKSRDMLDKQGMMGYNTMCWLKVKIFDFYNSGGFQMEDHMVEGNIMKLKMELESLESNIGKPQFDKMMSLISGLIAGISLVSGK